MRIAFHSEQADDGDFDDARLALKAFGPGAYDEWTLTDQGGDSFTLDYPTPLPENEARAFAEKIADWVSKDTGGTVTFDLFYDWPPTN